MPRPVPEAEAGPWPGGTWQGHCGATATIEGIVEVERTHHRQRVEVSVIARSHDAYTTVLRCVLPFQHEGRHSAVRPDTLAWEG